MLDELKRKLQQYPKKRYREDYTRLMTHINKLRIDLETAASAASASGTEAQAKSAAATAAAAVRDPEQDYIYTLSPEDQAAFIQQRERFETTLLQFRSGLRRTVRSLSRHILQSLTARQ